MWKLDGSLINSSPGELLARNTNIYKKLLNVLLILLTRYLNIIDSPFCSYGLEEA